MVREKRSAIDLAKASKEKSKTKYVLKLYVAGVTRRSSAAIRSITEICEEYLKDRYILEIIDIYKNPTLAKGEQIIAAPTLIRELPQPLRKFIGDLADRDKVLVGLNLEPFGEEKREGQEGRKP